MFKLNGEVHQKGKEEFATQFKAQLKENREWDMDIVWGESVDIHDDKSETPFTVNLSIARVLTLANGEIEDFGIVSTGIEKVWLKEALKKKERELVKKMQLAKKIG